MSLPRLQQVADLLHYIEQPVTASVTTRSFLTECNNRTNFKEPGRMVRFTSMKTYRKINYPLAEIRRYLESGPVVLVSSAWKGRINIMTMGWHMMMEFSPALFGCIISNANHSFSMLRRSKECVVNLPTSDLIDEVVGIGNTSGAQIDKFQNFGLTPGAATKVGAPLIKECYANFECKLADDRLISKYGLFIWEVVKAHVATSPKNPSTLHYRGKGLFMISGRSINRRRQFRPQNL